VFLSVLLRGVELFVRFHRLLIPELQLLFAMMILLTVCPWQLYYSLHSRLSRRIKEDSMTDPRPLKEMLPSSFASTFVSYIAIGLCLRIIQQLFQRLR
jgi:hypothetical protein